MPGHRNIAFAERTGRGHTFMTGLALRETRTAGLAGYRGDVGRYGNGACPEGFAGERSPPDHIGGNGS